ncbi:hypothetical protein [Streptomyces nojiriensis]|uniref:hypothetical protein n=1 Tax=Streptomyces nojiriensis TaxID=66374 RepID=UPI00369FFDD5
MVVDPAADGEDVVRAGAYGGRSLAVAYGPGDGAARPAGISRKYGGGDPPDPSVDRPPAMFSCTRVRDGVAVCDSGISSGIGQERWRGGEQPDLPLPEPVAAGVPHPDGRYARPDDGSHRDRGGRTPARVGTRFGPGLPRGVPEEEPLPAFGIA